MRTARERIATVCTCVNVQCVHVVKHVVEVYGCVMQVIILLWQLHQLHFALVVERLLSPLMDEISNNISSLHMVQYGRTFLQKN